MFLGTSIIQSVAKYGLKRSSLAVPLLAIVQSTCLFLASKLILLPLAGIDADSDDGRATTVCCSFGNSGVVPLIFCESLFRQSANSDYVAQSTAFVSLFLIGWSPYFWSFGRSVLIPDRSGGASKTKSGREKLVDLAKQALPPPVVGVFVGLFIATTPLCRLFLSPPNSDSKAPLSIIFNSIANFGRAASPLSLLILVSSLAVGAGIGNHIANDDSSKQVAGRGDESDGTTETKLLTKWAVVSITRFLFSPALMYGLLHLAERMGAIGGVDVNPMLWFVLILEATMPPAQNSVTMLQVADRGDDGASMAMFLFSVYLTSMIPVVIVLTFALQKFKLA